MSFSLGSFTFIDMSPMPELIGQQVMTESRPGVAGHNLWLTGARGNPQTITTWRDCINLADAITAMTNYRAAIGSRLAIVWNGNALPRYYDVLNVGPETVERTIGGVGGVLGTSGALLIAQWQLIVTDVAV